MAGAPRSPSVRPVLRGLLLTGTEPQYLRRDLSGGDEPDWASASPIWWPPTKIVGRNLGPFLASLTGDVPRLRPSAALGGRSVDVPLDSRRSRVWRPVARYPPLRSPRRAPEGTSAPR